MVGGGSIGSIIAGELISVASIMLDGSI
jgi:hypothetical protein